MKSYVFLLIEIFKVLQVPNFYVTWCSSVFSSLIFCQLFIFTWSKMAMVRKLHVLSRTVLKSPFFRPKTLCTENRTNFLARGTCTTHPMCKEQEVKVTFIKASGERIEAKGKVGDTLLDIVVNNDIDLDGFGACQGTVTCSTCHLIVPKDVYDNLPEKPSTDEIDMLDLVHEITETSRLGCQITMTKELDGLEIHVPCSINDARSTDL